MGFDDVIGQAKVTHMLQNAIMRGRLAHAYIFVGSDRFGLKTMAVEFAKAVNCLHSEDNSCDKCINCVRIANSNHPDVRMITPDGKTIKIEQIRQLQQRASYQTNDLQKKIVIIDAAETMTVQAANSLLKFLEEPVGDIIFLLLVENIHALLSTIVSRCQIVPFRMLPPHVIANELRSADIPKFVLNTAAAMANSVEDAHTLATAPWFTESIKLVTAFTELVRTPSRAIAFIHEQIMASEVGQHHMASFLDLMILWYQDMLKVSLGSQPLSFQDFSDKLLEQTSKWTESRLVHAVEQLLLAQRELDQYVQPQAVLEGWVLSVQEV